MVAKDIATRWEWPLRRFAWLEVAWGAFALANLVAMWLVPTWETVPFHFIWVSLTLVYGFRVWNLVSRVVNSLKIAGEVVEDLVGGLGPHKRLGVLVPGRRPGGDVGLQLGDAAMG
jgi:hypothetical protein